MRSGWAGSSGVGRTGRLRPGFVVDDLILMLTAHQGLQHAPRPARLTASRRFAAYVIEAFRAAPESGVPTPRPSATRPRPAHSPGTM